MLEDFITRGLVLVLGYAYPAFGCFKTVEKNKVEIQELRFWCQYWIIVAFLTVIERIGDVFVSWLPLYGEMKLALFIYLWYPKTKGTGYVYETFLRPYMVKHEADIDRNLQELRARGWDLATNYWQKCTKLGQITFFQILQILAAQSGKVTKDVNVNTDTHYPNTVAPQSSPGRPPSFRRHSSRHKQPSERRRPPSAPAPSATKNHSMIVQSPKPDLVQVQLIHSQAEFIEAQEEPKPGSFSSSGSGSTDEPEIGMDHSLHAARLRLRRSKIGLH